MNRRNSIDLVIVTIAVFSTAMIIFLALLFPEIFWDRFLWKYFWGPIVSDAGGHAEGITSSYNVYDTLTYGIILALSAYYIHRLFVRLELRVGLWFFIALSPVIVLGPACRVLEDMELFNEPLQYVFISPLIYIFLGISTLITILISLLIERRYPSGGKRYASSSTLFLLIPGLVVSIVAVGFPKWLNQEFSIVPFLFISLLAALLFARVLRKPRYEKLVLAFWGQILLFVIYAYILWLLHGDWYQHYVSLEGIPDKHYLGGLLIFLLAGFSTALVYVIIRFAAGKWESLGKMVHGINVMIILGHMLDASATSIGIDFFDYREKHVLPSFLIDRSGTAFVMFPLKLVFILPALYFIDRIAEDNRGAGKHMIALVRLAVLILGFAPGTRDTLRLMLGV